MPLTQELRRMGIPVTPFTPSRGALISLRACILHLCLRAALFGVLRLTLLDEVMEECAAFPHGEHDDLADSMTQAILRLGRAVLS